MANEILHKKFKNKNPDTIGIGVFSITNCLYYEFKASAPPTISKISPVIAA